MNTNRRNMIFIVVVPILLGAGFVYGFLAGKTKFFPYRLIENVYNMSSFDELLGANSLKDTSLFPIRMTTYRWPLGGERYSRGGGGITALAGRVLGVDKNGEFFVFDQNKKFWSLGTSINTNREDLAAKGNDPKTPSLDALRSFRFMDIEAKVIEERTHLFVIYDYWHSDKECKTTRVSRFISDDFDRVVTGEVPMENADWELVYESQPCLKFSYRNASPFQSPNTGGRLAVNSQNSLFMSLGDHHLDGVNNPRISSQSDELDYGKIFTIDIETFEAQPYAYGIRNPQGMTFDTRGNLWETEHGPQGGDELNLIRGGVNYGWPLTTFGTQYGRWQWKLNEDQGHHKGFELPVHAWVPSIGISNLVRIEDQPALWKDDLLISSLKTGSLYRVRLQNDRVMLSEEIKVGERIRDIVLMEDGSVMLWTDSRNIISIVAEPKDEGNYTSVAERLSAMGVPANLNQVILNCMNCHSFSKDNVSESVPPLWGVVGRSIGASGYPNYSNALQERSSDKWDRESLKAFIKNPQDFALGSTMPATIVMDDQTLDELVEYLQTLN